MASKMRPSSSICSVLSLASGLSITASSSQLYDDAPLRGVDAGADHLAVRAGDLAVAQIADLAGAELADARVADALAAAERQLEPLLLAGDEYRRGAVALDLAVRLG